jgi:hypothetical protein
MNASVEGLQSASTAHRAPHAGPNERARRKKCGLLTQMSVKITTYMQEESVMVFVF